MDKAAKSKQSRMPVVFVGHGSPMNAIDDNRFSRAFTELGRTLENNFGRPRAILAISAHWETSTTAFSSNAQPPTIHDFGGFPPKLHAVQYPAPGDVALAKRAKALVVDAELSDAWGLDHGTWSVLKWMAPSATTPVVQMSLRRGLSPPEQIALGRRLSPLRDEGVLILGSGNITHNLPDAFSRLRSVDATTPAWAERFDAAIADALRDRDAEALTTLLASEDGRVAHPTPEHFSPLLYVFGASDAGEAPDFVVEGFDAGSISMRSVVFGG